MPTFSPASRNRLTVHDRDRFAGDSLFDRIGRTVCEAGCLPRKELYEAWEVARRARRLFRGGRIVDAGGGHGLLAHILLLLDDSSPAAVVVDPGVPASAEAIRDCLSRQWPRLTNRVDYRRGPLDDEAVQASDLVVSSHACGTLTDRVIDAAAGAGAPVAVLPCCHDRQTCDAGALGGWLDVALAIDVMRVVRLEQRGYRVWTQQIPATITPKNRLLLATRVAVTANF